MGHNTWITRTCLSSLTFWTLLYKLKGEQCKFAYFLLLPSYLQAKQVQDHQHEHSNCEMDKPGDEGGFPGQGISQKKMIGGFSMTFVSGVLLRHPGCHHQGFLC